MCFLPTSGLHTVHCVLIGVYICDGLIIIDVFHFLLDVFVGLLLGVKFFDVLVLWETFFGLGAKGNVCTVWTLVDGGSVERSNIGVFEAVLVWLLLCLLSE